jgi:hypothetical protein
MTLLGLPAAQLAAIFAGAGGVLFALYLLRQRRRRLEVPFARLWQKVLHRSEATTLWHRLKRWLSLLLQLLLLALLVLSLGDPRLAASKQGRTMVLLIDASASMQAVTGTGTGPGGRTRLDLARDEARRLIRDLAGDDVAVVVALDSQPAPQGGLSSDERDLLAQVESVTAKDGPADLPRALRLCADLLAGRDNPQVVLISDGGFDDATLAVLAAERKAPALHRLDLRYAPVGAPDPAAGNVAITAFSVRRYRHNRLSYEVLLELRSFSIETGQAGQAGQTGAASPTKVKLELLQEGETVDVQELTLAPGERVQRLYPDLAGSGVHLTARIRPAGPDLLPLDDQAYAVLPQRRRQRALLVTRGNLYVEGALLAASAGDENGFQVSKLKPADYTPAQAAAYDAVIFDDFTPPEPPAAHALYLNPQGETSPFPITGTVPAPLVTDRAKDHPVMRWINLKDLNASRASVFRLAPGDVALSGMLGKAILAAGTRQVAGAPRRVVALGLDIRQSDLPLRPALPLLLINTLDWFAGDADGQTQGFATGHTWRIPLHEDPHARTGAAARAATLRLPDGEKVLLPVHEGHALYHGQRVGFYEVERAGEGQAPLLLSANLADATESAARFRQTLSLGEGPPLPAPEVGRSAIKRVLWPYLILTLLLLLCLEWWTYQRRWTV